MIEAETGWDGLTRKLRQFVARRVPGSDVDDVLQEALLRIQRGLSGLRDDERFGAWVYRVTRSAVADHLRASARPIESGREAADERLEAQEPDASDELASELLGCLSSFVAELPSPYREAITLTELEGLSQREAASMLGLSVSGMKSRVQRGRERLRETFERCCELTQDARGRVIGCEPRSGRSSLDRC
jgi:RNA polymerase sigma-70 factor, ECF subfamily